mmetsp:Transcript_1770/g.4314  ORF Transcript_1770/g.4314 Transcript_1770/m.4314 type:complete len:151 (+) Transcript_1770:462-914(+)
MLNFHPNKLFSKTAQGPQFGGAQHRHLAQAYLLICLPVGPQLRLPGKVLDVAHVVPDEVGHHVSRVHVHDHQRAQRGALELGEVAADEVHDAHQSSRPRLVWWWMLSNMRSSTSTSHFSTLPRALLVSMMFLNGTLSFSMEVMAVMVRSS